MKKAIAAAVFVATFAATVSVADGCFERKGRADYPAKFPRN